MAFCFRKKFGNNIIIPVFGIEDSGKSSLIARLRNDPNDPHGPNNGFEQATVLFKHGRKYSLKLYDVGGGMKIRGIWNNYVAEAHALIYVVNGDSTMEKIKESALEFAKIVNQKDILFLINRRQKEIDIEEFIHSFNLKNYGNVITDFSDLKTHQDKNVILIQVCKLKGYFNVPLTKKKKRLVFPEECDLPPNLDPRVICGLKKLLDVVNEKRQKIEERIDRDVKLWKEEYERQLLEKKERLSQLPKPNIIDSSTIDE